MGRVSGFYVRPAERSSPSINAEAGSDEESLRAGTVQAPPMGGAAYPVRWPNRPNSDVSIFRAPINANLSNGVEGTRGPLGGRNSAKAPTMELELSRRGAARGTRDPPGRPQKVRLIWSLKEQHEKKVNVGPLLRRVLDTNPSQGSVILFAGQPGGGKSTFFAQSIKECPVPCLYVATEERWRRSGRGSVGWGVSWSITTRR